MAKFNGKFNWYGQVFDLWTENPSFIGAFQNFCQQMAEKVNRKASSVRIYFHRTGNYEVKES